MPNSKNHRILIVCDAFGRPAYNPRLRSLCDYLVAQGWQVEVLTERFEPLPFPHTYPITEIPVYQNRSIDWFFKAVVTLLFDWKSRFFARKVREQVADKHYDLVFVSTFPPTPLRAAVEIAKAQHIPLHIDLRDIDEQTPTNQYQAHRTWHSRLLHGLFRVLNIRRRNALLTKADSLSSVSPWHVDFLRRWNRPTQLIYNGFDESLFAPKDERSDAFRIVYTGRLYDKALQDPSLFFKALQELKAANRLPAELRVEWYTDEAGKARVLHWANETGTTALMTFHPFVPTEAIPDILHQSSIVLVASRKSSEKGPHGIMTTKFFEALGVEKPVLCVPSDEECLAQVISETKAGIAASDTEVIKTFLLARYKEWKTNSFTRQAVDTEQKKRFTRRYQAQQFESLFHALLQPAPRPLLTDICWTLFYSNTTYDFLRIKGNKWNSLIYKLFGYDGIRSRAIRRFQTLSREEQLARAEQFYADYLAPRKIAETWTRIDGRDIILVSQTMDIIAEVVAKHVGAKQYFATQTKSDLLTHFTDFDIITDNSSDLELIRHAHEATIITYNNRSRWEKLLPRDINVTFIETGKDKY